MEQHALKNVSNCLYINSVTSGGQSSNPYFNVLFSTLVLIRHLCQLKTVVFLHWCLIWAVLLIDDDRPSLYQALPKQNVYKKLHNLSNHFGLTH